jgi:hypothetical protein
MVDGDVLGEPGDVRLLDLRIVEIVEVIKDGNGVSRGEQAFNEMGADETSAAGDQNSHVAQLATNCYRWTQFLRLHPYKSKTAPMREQINPV